MTGLSLSFLPGGYVGEELGIQQATLGGDQQRLGTALHPQFPVDIGYVESYSAEAQEQLVGDLFVAPSCS